MNRTVSNALGMGSSWLKRLFPNTLRMEFCGESFLFDKERRRLFAHIREPYWKAWRDFGWSVRCPGIGLNRLVLEFAKQNRVSIFIIVGDNWNRAYRTDLEYWLTNGDHKTVNGVEVLVLPWHESHFQTVTMNDLVEGESCDE